MTKSVFTPAYESFREALVSLRKEQGLTQVELASRLGKPQQFVSAFELGSRRLDVVEFYVVMAAMGLDPRAGFDRAIRGIEGSVLI